MRSYYRRDSAPFSHSHPPPILPAPVAIALTVVTGEKQTHTETPISTTNLNARQRLVGPNGVPADHVDAVVVHGHARLVLAWGEGGVSTLKNSGSTQGAEGVYKDPEEVGGEGGA